MLLITCRCPSWSLPFDWEFMVLPAAVYDLFVISIYSFGAEIFISRLPELDGHCSLGAPLLWRVAP